MDPDYDEGAADEELFAQELELLARRAFAEYLADGDAAEERADDVLEMDELRPNRADRDREQLVRVFILRPVRLALTY